MEQQIPKILHYCWFGSNPLPPLLQECIKTWSQHCPEYKIMCWNEESYDIHSNAFVEQAYQKKHWAFIADYVRLDVLLRYGGVYLDTDVELLQPLDPLLKNDCFTGFETKDTVATGVIGCTKDHPIIQKLFACYKDHEYLQNGERTITTGPILFTNVLKDSGLLLTGKKQVVSGCTVYPSVVFYPTGIHWIAGRYSSKTMSVHHYTDSWRGSTISDSRTLLSRIRLSLVFCGRNLIGTSRMYELSRRIKK